MIVTVIRKPVDLLVTSLLWVYYIFGFLLFFAPVLIWKALLKNDDEIAYQASYNRFFRIFFYLVNALSPGLTIEIDPKVADIRSAVIIANHLSYLDPLLFISLYKCHKTIVKNSFFKVPVFGWLLKKSGYVPSSANSKHMALVVKQISQMSSYLAKGGNLFIFPEGTRSKDGKLNAFNRGAFSIARQCQAPVKVVYIKNTNRLFKPGSGIFNTCQRNTISMELLGSLDPLDKRFEESPEKMSAEAKELICKRIAEDQAKE